jgi:hypothetical protein
MVREARPTTQLEVPTKIPWLDTAFLEVKMLCQLTLEPWNLRAGYLTKPISWIE